MTDPRLEFYLSLPNSRSQRLLSGCLILKRSSSDAGIKLQATSGCLGNQYHRSWVLKGKGPLPPTSAIAPHEYSVSTQRLWLPHVKGVEGSFYAIAPFSVSVTGINRGDFGVHFDANVPGSAGCCVIQLQKHWDMFRSWMSDIRSVGIQKVPLEVTYKQF